MDKKEAFRQIENLIYKTILPTLNSWNIEYTHSKYVQNYCTSIYDILNKMLNANDNSEVTVENDECGNGWTMAMHNHNATYDYRHLYIMMDRDPDYLHFRLNKTKKYDSELRKMPGSGHINSTTVHYEYSVSDDIRYVQIWVTAGPDCAHEKMIFRYCNGKPSAIEYWRNQIPL